MVVKICFAVEKKVQPKQVHGSYRNSISKVHDFSQTSHDVQGFTCYLILKINLHVVPEKMEHNAEKM